MTINYIAVFYIGPNRTYKSYQAKFDIDPLYFFKIHLDFLSTCNADIKLSTFVFNDDISQDLKSEIHKLAEQSEIANEIVFRQNGGFSYGAWNDIIKKNINDFDYFFMIEDDYIPDAPDFYIPFQNKITDSIPYCCTYIGILNGIRHAASSNGMIQAKACKDILSKYQEIFKVDLSNSLHQAWQTQLTFLDYLTEQNYDITDIIDLYSVQHALNCNTNDVRIFGQQDSRCLILPILL
jgi:hypothetical protein